MQSSRTTVLYSINVSYYQSQWGDQQKENTATTSLPRFTFLLWSLEELWKQKECIKRIFNKLWATSQLKKQDDKVEDMVPATNPENGEPWPGQPPARRRREPEFFHLQGTYITLIRAFVSRQHYGKSYHVNLIPV